MCDILQAMSNDLDYQTELIHPPCTNGLESIGTIMVSKKNLILPGKSPLTIDT